MERDPIGLLNDKIEQVVETTTNGKVLRYTDAQRLRGAWRAVKALYEGLEQENMTLYEEIMDLEYDLEKKGKK